MCACPWWGGLREQNAQEGRSKVPGACPAKLHPEGEGTESSGHSRSRMCAESPERPLSVGSSTPELVGTVYFMDAPLDGVWNVLPLCTGH